MILSLSSQDLLSYISRQAEHLFPDGVSFVGNDIKSAFSLGLERLENSIKTVTLPGYHNEKGIPTFSHMHADQYAQLLYFFGNSLWKTSQNRLVCDKLLAMNRVLHSLFISYKCNLPDHFVLGHPIGTILGNADYNDFLVVFQGVTVNTSQDSFGKPAPHLGKGLFLGAHSKIIGAQTVGDRVSIGVNAMLYERDVPEDSVVLLVNGDVLIRPRKKETCKAQDYFNVRI